MRGSDSHALILLLDENVTDTAVQVEVIPTTAELKENVAMAICRAAKNGKLLFLLQVFKKMLIIMFINQMEEK